MRYLNSDISWFGVGGKQAIFFIGNATRVNKFVYRIKPPKLELFFGWIPFPDLKNLPMATFFVPP
jgi:hypothetical protein